jgi:hypothetical protein
MRAQHIRISTLTPAYRFSTPAPTCGFSTPACPPAEDGCIVSGPRTLASAPLLNTVVVVVIVVSELSTTAPACSLAQGVALLAGSLAQDCSGPRTCKAVRHQGSMGNVLPVPFNVGEKLAQRPRRQLGPSPFSVGDEVSDFSGHREAVDVACAMQPRRLSAFIRV